MKYVQKIWGSELIIVNNLYCGKRMQLKKGYTSSLHLHLKKQETFYVENGKLQLEIKNKDSLSKFHILEKNDIFTIFPGTLHAFCGLEETVFFEFSTHDDPDDSVRVNKSHKGCLGYSNE